MNFQAFQTCLAGYYSDTTFGLEGHHTLPPSADVLAGTGHELDLTRRSPTVCRSELYPTQDCDMDMPQLCPRLPPTTTYCCQDFCLQWEQQTGGLALLVQALCVTGFYFILSSERLPTYTPAFQWQLALHVPSFGGVRLSGAYSSLPPPNQLELLGYFILPHPLLSFSVLPHADLLCLCVPHPTFCITPIYSCPGPALDIHSFLPTPPALRHVPSVSFPDTKPSSHHHRT